MRVWVRSMLDGLVMFGCAYGAIWIDNRYFRGNLGKGWVALIMALLYFLSYPLWAWGRKASWRFFGKAAFSKWLLSTAGVWILAVLIQAIAGMVVHYYRPA